MTIRIRVLGLSAALAAFVGMVYLANQTRAAQDKDTVAKVTEIAAAIKKGDKAGADKIAAAYGKKLESLEEVMHLFKPRKKGGLGLGKPGDVTPDGIELKILAMKRDGITPTSLKKEAAGIEEAAYIVAAIGAIAKHTPHLNDLAKKSPKDWVTWSQETVDASVGLAEATKKGGNDVKMAATKLDNLCNQCHSKYR